MLQSHRAKYRTQYFASAARTRLRGDYGLNMPYYEEYDPAWEIHFYSIAPLPAAFYVSQESREAVIKRYTLCFASESSPAAIYFNFEIGTLFLDRHFHAVGTRFLGCLSDVERQGITRLAVDETVLDSKGLIEGPDVGKDELAVFRVQLLTLPMVTELTFTAAVGKALKEGNDGKPKNAEEGKDFGFALDNFFFDDSRWAEMYTVFPAEIMDMEEVGFDELPNIWLL